MKYSKHYESVVRRVMCCAHELCKTYCPQRVLYSVWVQEETYICETERLEGLFYRLWHEKYYFFNYRIKLLRTMKENLCEFQVIMILPTPITKRKGLLNIFDSLNRTENDNRKRCKTALSVL